eukprot:3288042-Ditylum_brightwellii.AAC.1
MQNTKLSKLGIPTSLSFLSLCPDTGSGRTSTKNNKGHKEEKHTRFNQPLPTKNSATKVFKHGSIQDLCEQVTTLVDRGDALAFKYQRNKIPAPMIVVGKVFGA